MISRRVLMAGALAPGIAAAPVWDDLRRVTVAAIQARLAAIPVGPALLASYLVEAGDGDFGKVNANVAYTYDNALAGLALLAAGDAASASRIGEALRLAQDHDPDHDPDHADGRLRNAYRAGRVEVPVGLPGWWSRRRNGWLEDPYQIGVEAGPMAWAMLLWTALAGKSVNAAAYGKAARRAGGWISAKLPAPRGFYGGFFGFPPHPQKLTWVSTEQNTDLAIAFRRLGMKPEADHAAAFVRAMSDGHRLIGAGLTPDGGRNPMIAADANIWPLLAGLLPETTKAIRALGWPRGRPEGVGFSEASHGIWLEGTAFTALWLRLRHDPLAPRFARTILGNIAASGYVDATVPSRLRTGLAIGPSSISPGRPAPRFDYFRYPALAPTAWAALAALAACPLAP